MIRLNNSFLHHKENNLKSIYFYATFLLLFYGFYKNGIVLYNETKLSLSVIFKPLLFPIFSLLISLSINYFKTKKIQLENKDIYLFILSLTMPIGMNILLYFVLQFIFTLLSKTMFKHIKINDICLYKIISVLILFLFKQYNYANALEITGKYSYDLFDIFLGKGISGVFTSSLLFLFIGYLILCTNYYYKSDIFLYSISSYFIVALLFKLILHKGIIINGLLLFAFIFIASISELSPADKRKRVVYSLITGGITAIFTYFLFSQDGVFFAIFLASFLNYIHLK